MCLQADMTNSIKRRRKTWVTLKGLYNPFNVTQVFLLLLMLLVMSAWRHMQVVFIVMGLPRPASGSDRESVVTAEKANDFPPKYEDVTEKPPKYDEATMTQTQ